MFLEVVPSFSSMVFRCGEGCVLEACSTSSSRSSSSSSSSSSSRPSSCNLFFFLESRRDVKPRGSMFLEVVPSFSSMLFRCGEECVLEICSTISTGHNTCAFYFVSAPCHGTAQHLATKRGDKWEGLFT